jgi:Fic family protein
MDTSLFGPQKTGELVKAMGMHEASRAFVPAPLPPDMERDEAYWKLLVKARSALASLDGTGKHLPNPGLLLRPLQDREAQRSSSLEGTHADPQQLLIYRLDPSDADPAEASSRDAYHEVENYTRALRIRSGSDLPLSLRLIRTLHEVLMHEVRGQSNEPGAFRTLQVQVGRPSRYVPPPAHRLSECLNALEHYLHAEKQYDPLVEAFLVHYQLEAIHPFRDGNGRVGRLLLALTIAQWCDLADQWLYMSAFFDAHKDEYIDRLFGVSTEGDWKGWVMFCLQGVVEQAADTERRCARLLSTLADYKERVQSIPRASHRLAAITEGLFDQPLISTPQLAEQYDVTYPTARKDIDKLMGVDILVEVPGFEGRYGTTYYFAPVIFGAAFDDLQDAPETSRSPAAPEASQPSLFEDAT